MLRSVLTGKRVSSRRAAVSGSMAKPRRAAKRGGGERPVTLTTGVPDQAFAEGQLPGLGRALAELEKVDPRCKRVVEMRYFAGLTEPAPSSRRWTRRDEEVFWGLLLALTVFVVAALVVVVAGWLS